MHVGAVKYCVCTLHFITVTLTQNTFYKTTTHIYNKIIVLHSSICHAKKIPKCFQKQFFISKAWNLKCSRFYQTYDFKDKSVFSDFIVMSFGGFSFPCSNPRNGWTFLEKLKKPILIAFDRWDMRTWSLHKYTPESQLFLCSAGTWSL